MSDPTAHPPSPASPLAGIGLLVLRAGLSVILLVLHGLPMATSAWKFVWQKQPWPLVDQLTELDYGYPSILATACALALTVFPFCVLLGFLGRITAALLMIALGALLMTGFPLENHLPAEAAYLYLAGFAAIFIGGSGALSLDRIFSRKTD